MSDDVRRLKGLGLQFAEIPIVDPDKFAGSIGEYQALKKNSDIYYLCHGPREGDANDPETLENTYFPKLMRILAIMPQLDMRLLTIHLWLDARFVKHELMAYKIGFLQRVIDRAKETGTTVCLENLSETASHMEGIFKALPELSMTLDLGHAKLLTEGNTAFGFWTNIRIGSNISTSMITAGEILRPKISIFRLVKGSLIFQESLND